jgi:hypothetical protein
LRPRFSAAEVWAPLIRRMRKNHSRPNSSSGATHPRRKLVSAPAVTPVYATSFSSSVSVSVVVPRSVGGMSLVNRTSSPLSSVNEPLTEVSEISTGPSMSPASTRFRNSEYSRSVGRGEARYWNRTSTARNPSIQIQGDERSRRGSPEPGPRSKPPQRPRRSLLSLAIRPIFAPRPPN